MLIYMSPWLYASINKDNITNLTHNINDINIMCKNSKAHFVSLSASTAEISSALKIINDVSEQTNLLFVKDYSNELIHSQNLITERNLDEKTTY